MKASILIIFTVLFLSGCEKSDKKEIPLSGRWIEIKNKVDTIYFSNNSPKGSLYLHQGFAVYNGYKMPKGASGQYYYEIKENSIWLLNGFSSSTSGNYTYFKIDSKTNTFDIGNFKCGALIVFDSTQTVLTFQKIP